MQSHAQRAAQRQRVAEGSTGKQPPHPVSKKIFRVKPQAFLTRPQTGSPSHCPDSERFSRSSSAEAQEQMRRLERHEQHEVSSDAGKGSFSSLCRSAEITSLYDATAVSDRVLLTQVMVANKRQQRAQQERGAALREQAQQERRGKQLQHRAQQAAARAAAEEARNGFNIITLADK